MSLQSRLNRLEAHVNGRRPAGPILIVIERNSPDVAPNEVERSILPSGHPLIRYGTSTIPEHLKRGVTGWLAESNAFWVDKDAYDRL